MADDLISRGVAADWVMQFKQAVRVESTKYIDQPMADCDTCSARFAGHQINRIDEPPALGAR